MKIIINESQLHRILSEQLKIQKNGNYVNLNNQSYKLQVWKLGDWRDVNIDVLTPRNDGGYDIKASLGMFSQNDVVPVDTVNLIKSYIDKQESIIPLGGKTQKRLKKV
jgi:hypothetical protein